MCWGRPSDWSTPLAVSGRSTPTSRSAFRLSVGRRATNHTCSPGWSTTPPPDRVPAFTTYARYYHPRLQRFISEDPLQFGGGNINLFTYAGDDPVNRDDPLGLDVWGPGTNSAPWGPTAEDGLHFGFFGIKSTPPAPAVIRLEIEAAISRVRLHQPSESPARRD